MTIKPKTAALIVAAGSGSRAGEGVPKQFRLIQGHPMITHSARAFAAHQGIDMLVIVIGENQEEMAHAALEGVSVTAFIPGGQTRRESVFAGLEFLEQLGGVAKVLIHDAARPFLSGSVIDRLLEKLETTSGAVPALPVIDSLARSEDGATISQSESREGLWRTQTPQAFAFKDILSAHRNWNDAQEATDDARMAMASGFSVAMVPGDERLAKYTFPEDFTGKGDQYAPMQSFRTGLGYDVHRLVAGEELWLCGIKIDHEKGLSGHSDADVALHALTDAILGAATLGDIGDHFPPSEPQWRGASSDQFLAHAVKLAMDKGYALVHVDVTIICEAPKIGPHKAAMQVQVSRILGIDRDNVSIKATTTERLGFTGRGEGIAAQAVATLSKRSNYAH